MRRRAALILAALVTATVPARPARADEPPFTRKEDVIYGRKYGTALTLDVFTPARGANGAAVVVVISGGFFSSHEAINPAFLRPLTDRGYTVFAVVHGSQPRYTTPEIIKDLNRAVRFIRHHAKDYAIDPDRIGVSGASAGGHLSLMLGTAGDAGDPDAKDPVDRASSRVQAVACFFPPTDFLNFGAPGRALIHARDHAKTFRPAFDYQELDRETNLWTTITDDAKLREITRAISPIYSVTPDDPPTLVIHGDADTLVPLQQSEAIVERLKSAGVAAKLVVKPGAGHGWLTMARDMTEFADWFDAHLKPREAAKEKAAGCVEAAPAGLPEPWDDRDVGDVVVKGSAAVDGGVFTVAGTLDIWGKADGFHFVHRPLVGDGQVVARVLEVQNTNEHAKAGVTIRESLDPGARHATMVVTPVDGTQFLRRKAAGGLTTNTNPGRNRGKLPYWVKLVRKGDEFSAFESPDGTEWTHVGTETLPLGKEALVGLVVSSHQKGVTNTSKLDHVSVEP